MSVRVSSGDGVDIGARMVGVFGIVFTRVYWWLCERALFAFCKT